MEPQQEKRTSIAKSQVAQQKPRDESGRFLSGEELQQYQVRQQQVQMQAEKEKLDAIFGRQGQQQTTQSTTPQPQGNFQAILNSSLGRTQQTDAQSKWDTLLGKRRFR